MSKYTYKDIMTGKEHFTRGPFIGWSEPTGILNQRYAMFQLHSETLLIPGYCLTRETRTAIAPMPRDEEGSVQQEESEEVSHE